MNSTTDNGRQEATDRLFAEKCSCVIRNGNQLRIFRERGVKDLYRLLKEEPELLRGAFVADKVVGKGAAALMVLGGVVEVFADVVSESARELFDRSGIPIKYTLLVPHIVNRTQTDRCPLEKRCADASTAGECLPLIKEFIEEQRAGSQAGGQIFR